MKIIVTYQELIEKGCWEEFCILKKVNEYCVAEGCSDQTKAELSEEEATELNLI